MFWELLGGLSGERCLYVLDLFVVGAGFMGRLLSPVYFYIGSGVSVACRVESKIYLVRLCV